MRIPTAAAVATVFLLSACGTGSDGAVVDPAPTNPTASSGSPTPEATPTVGSYPSFTPSDYTYTLRVQCFCAGAGTPIRVTVVGGKVTRAVYAESGRGVHRGDPADGRLAVTIAQVIGAANDTGAATVEVTWPAGQDYPSSVSVDQSKQMADEEIGYTVSDVVIG